MARTASSPADIGPSGSGRYRLSGHWTVDGLGDVARRLDAALADAPSRLAFDGAAVEAVDTAGLWLLLRRAESLRKAGGEVGFDNWSPEALRLLDMIARHASVPVVREERPPPLERLGRLAAGGAAQAWALLGFVGETALAFATALPRPARWRVRPILNNLQSAGWDALPIVGLTALLLGIVVAWQGAVQLKRYGAHIFVVDLVGFSMLREFAPLITAVIVAGRSGSAYAAQIGTMAVTDEIDALRTLGVPPIDLLVLPKLIALFFALPLLTVYADILGVIGGMITANVQLGIGPREFLDRFGRFVPLSSFLVGVGKAFVFAVIIAVVGCFQGFRTRGSAESVGRQTTRAVVESIFLVIVADALFSVAFSQLKL